MDVRFPGYNDNSGSLARSKTALFELEPKSSLYHRKTKTRPLQEENKNKKNKKTIENKLVLLDFLKCEIRNLKCVFKLVEASFYRLKEVTKYLDWRRKIRFGLEVATNPIRKLQKSSLQVAKSGLEVAQNLIWKLQKSVWNLKENPVLEATKSGILFIT